MASGPYVASWDEFENNAQKLYEQDPARCRYTIQYHHRQRQAVMKVTDDKVCIKFKTDQYDVVRQMERLNNWFFTKMVGRDPAAVQVGAADEDDAIGGGGGGGGGGGSPRRKGKGKKR